MLNIFVNTARAVSLPDFSTTQDIGTFVGDIYAFAISIVGILIFIRFVWAGWLYITAAGNSANVSKAKSMMTGAIIGAVIIFSSYLILYVINPDLVDSTFNISVPTGPSNTPTPPPASTETNTPTPTPTPTPVANP